MLNVWIGMCKGIKGLPRDLRDLGYQDFTIEYKFTNVHGEVVMPELIIGSEKLSHTILLEWKSGADFEDNQLRRYNGITHDDLVSKAFLEKNVCLFFNVCVLGKDEFKSRLEIGLDKGSFIFPFIVCSPNSMTLVKNSFDRKEVDSVFQPSLVIDLEIAPTNLIPYNEESSDWEIADVIMPHVISLMIKREPNFTLDSLCSETLRMWESIASEKQNQIKNKVERVVVEAAKNEFRRYIGRNKGLQSRTHSSTWDIKRNPLDVTSSRRSKEFKDLQKLQRSFIVGLKTGKRPAIQEDMFES
jgi:hypothetical protein